MFFKVSSKYSINNRILELNSSNKAAAIINIALLVGLGDNG
jgi:hypothetical protein